MILAALVDVETATNFFVVLTVVANVVVVVALLAALVAAIAPSTRRALASACEAVGSRGAIGLGAVVATVTTAGSLYYSESVGYLPCELCWFQRICMYPLVVVLTVGWLRRDARTWMTAGPLVAIGASISTYHWLVERVPAFSDSTSCSLDAPCAVPYFERFGFITLSWMCLSSFLLIASLLIVGVVARRADSSATDGSADDAVDTVGAPARPSPAGEEPPVGEESTP